MKNNFNQTVSHWGYFGCWIMILFISVTYAIASSTPWERSFFGLFKIPDIDPTVHLDTRFYVLPQKIAGNSYADIPPNEFLLEKSRHFYSGISTEFEARVFYRPDFEQFPVETLLILFFRLVTYAGLILFFYLLSLVLQSVTRGNPFEIKNYGRLFYMGLIATVVPVVILLHSTVLAAFINYDPRLMGYDISPSFISLWALPSGLILIILSFFFKESARIYEENKLTV